MNISYQVRNRVVLCGSFVFFALCIGIAARSDSTESRVADSDGPSAKFELRRGDHICIIGNTLAERMQHYGWLETLIHSRFSQHELVFRNLGFSGDEVAGFTANPDNDRRLRSMDFGTSDQWLTGSAPVPQPRKLNPDAPVRQNRFELTNTKADVIFAFFGYNESYADVAGLPGFRKDLNDFLQHTLQQKYNGKSPPRVVLFSSVAFENHKDRNLPDGDDVNKRLALYTQAMAEVAKANDVVFVDLFAPSQDLYRRAPEFLTINGIHLTEAGNREIAFAIDKALFGDEPKRDVKQLEKLRGAVADKNF